ncbi:hypothetical protein [Herpetosiphon geysericola]|nr:hypothetical protein [Herpetosiphon geysericola]
MPANRHSQKPKHSIPPSTILAYPSTLTLKPGDLEAWSERVSDYITTIHDRAATVGLRLKYMANESTNFDTPIGIWYVLNGNEIVLEGTEVEAYDYIEAIIEDKVIRS